MDYGVKYRIDLNGEAASASLNRFLTTTTTAIPKINKRFDLMNAKINQTLLNLAKLKTAMGAGRAGIGRINPTVNSKTAINSVNRIKRSLATIKNRKVLVTVAGGGMFGGKGGAAGKPGMLGKMFSPTSMMSAGGIPFATTIGAGLIGIGIKNMVSGATEFQHTMTSVRAILRTGDKDATTFDERFDSMSKTMRNLGVETKFTAVEIGNATRYLAMAGMSVETIQKSMKSVTNLAAIGDTDLGEMADVMTNIMTGYGIDETQISKAADNLAAAASGANVNVMEMGESMKYASSYMRMAGIDFSEGSSAIGVLGDAGIKGSRAGTSMRAMIIRFIKPTEQAKKVIDRLGVSFTRMVPENGKMQEKLKPLHEIFSDLKKAGASGEDLTAIFDKIGGAAALALTENADKVKELGDTARNSGGLADYQAAEKMKTLVGLGQQLNSKFMDLGQTLMLKLTPQISKMMTDLLGWLKTDDADRMFDSIAGGFSSILNGLKKATLFMKDNWGWLKYIFGGMAVKAVGGMMLGGVGGIGRTIGDMGRFVGGVGRLAGAGGLAGRAGYAAMGGVVNSAGTVSMLARIGVAGDAAALGVGAAAASLTAMLAGGVILAGVGGIAYGFYNAYKEAKRLTEIKDELSDWAVGSTGFNTEILDQLQSKLDNINKAGKEISNVKENLSGPQKKWAEAVAKNNNINGFGFTGFFSSILGGDKKSKANKDLLDATKEMALGGSDAAEIKELKLAFYRATSVEGQNEAMKALRDKSTHYNLIGRNASSVIGGNGLADGTDLSMRNSNEYNMALNEMTLAIIQQITDAAGTGVGQMGALKKLDILLGSDIDLSRARATIGRRQNENISVKDYEAILLEQSGTNIQSIKNSLQKQGIQSSYIDALMNQAKLSELLNAGIVSGTSVSRMTTDDYEGDDLTDDNGNTLGGTGRLSNRTGKAIIVNIDKLWNVEKASFTDERDLEDIKDRIAKALSDVVNDFSLGNH